MEENLGAGMEFIVDFSEMFSGHVSVDLSGCDLAVTKHELNGPEIGTTFQQMCCKGVTKYMRTDLLLQTCLLPIFFQHLPETLPGKGSPV